LCNCASRTLADKPFGMWLIIVDLLRRVVSSGRQTITILPFSSSIHRLQRHTFVIALRAR
ncbi:hypothetical protein VS873_23880, partial [Salmonella enterica subsp. enterica serovar Typhi]|nr:hypothetical protein [Salmonella enterica subsp. enterica serovar Typhi]